MIRLFCFNICVMFFFSCHPTALRQMHRTNDPGKDVYKREGYTLYFESNAPDFNIDIKKKMVATFFSVYPKLVHDFNARSSKVVFFKIDTAYNGVAATSGSHVVYSPEWFAKNPNDIDVVTHEVMHIVQAYGNTNGPWWLTEGIADYVRYKYGLNNEAADWYLPAYRSDQNYDNGYRVTASFLDWLVKNVNSDIVKIIDEHMRAHTYKAQLWQQYTGKTISELWKDYANRTAL